MNEAKTYWFPAKQYGWGWGLPITWQGWAVLIGFLALLQAGIFWLLPAYGKPVFIGYALLLAAILVIICWRKGEPPSWRWGKSEK